MITATRRDEHARAARRLGLSVCDWPALGTSAQLVVTDVVAMPAARTAVERVLADIDLAASRFRDDSELSRLNAAAGSWVEVSPLFARALRVGIDAAQWTDGVVDPTVGAALVRLGYDRTFSLVPPIGGPIAVGVTAAPGWQHVELDDSGDGTTARARVPVGTRVDLGATAKALAADLAAAAAADAAGCGVLVSLGGDIAVAGPAPADGWPIAVEDVTDLSLPADVGGQVVTIRDGGLATSSTRARRWQRGGVELHHLLDPRSGLPATGPWRTVSVTASTCVLANTASTAAVILGPAAPGWLRERGFHARLIGLDGSSVYVNEWPPGGNRSRADDVMTVMGVMASSTGFSSAPLWYSTRSTGIVAFVLLTISMFLGIAATQRSFASRQWPRFATQDLHRNVSLLALGFLLAHIITTLLDTFVTISWWSIVIPGVSSYRRLWVALGTIAFDVILVVIGTSLIRHRLPLRAWRVVHWSVYVVWPLAFVHFLETGTDAAHGRFGLWLDIVALLSLMLAVAIRLAGDNEPVGPLRSVAERSVAGRPR